MDIAFFKKYSLAKGLALFKKKGSSVLGVDLGSSSLKVVQLRKEKERAILETYGELACGRYASAEVGRSVRLVDQKVVEMLRDIVREANVSASRAIVAIPLRSSFVKMIALPLMSEKELKEAVPFEARKYIPVPIGEVMLDWWILPEGIGEERGKEEGFIKERKYQDVLLVAIHREVIEKYREIVQGVKLAVDAFEIEVFSQVRAVLSREIAPALLVDLGAESTRFTVVDYGVVRLTHTLDRGAVELTDVLSRSLGVDFERAERLKRDIGLSDRPEHKEILNVIEPLLDYIFAEGARVALEYRRRSGRSIKRVWLLGGGALLKGINEFSINKFGLETREAHPFSRVEYPAFLEPVLKEIGPSFCTSLGAALRALHE